MQSILEKKFLKKIAKTVRNDEDQRKAKISEKKPKKTEKKRTKPNESKIKIKKKI
jgi:hypothetical protein